ncbi:hypothetical protein CHI05_10890 [Bacillus sp. 7788]|nr:hypothetical protein CHI05_10890 [Bacillus sp. 7788]
MPSSSLNEKAKRRTKIGMNFGFNQEKALPSSIGKSFVLFSLNFLTIIKMYFESMFYSPLNSITSVISAL